MIFRIHQDNADSVRLLFERQAHNIQVASILDGNTRGEIWADRPRNPTVAAIWDGILTVFLAGNHESLTFINALVAWVESSVTPTVRRYGDSYFNLYCHSPEWQARLANIFKGYRVEPGTRCLHTFRGHPSIVQPLPNNFSLHRIDDSLLTRRDLEEQDWLQAWVTTFWHTKEDFLEKGVGYAVLHKDKKVVSLCLSLFVSGRQVEFGTATHPEFQNRGLSTNLASACVQECLNRELEPIWQCWDDNLPSLAVARKAGFVLQQKYTVYKLFLFKTENRSPLLDA